MAVETHVELAPLTTFRIGGPARAYVAAHNEEEIQAAIAFARDGGLPLFVLGAGSNVLVSDSGLERVVVHMKLGGIEWNENGDSVELVGGAGTLWEEVVDAACARTLFGIENLAGIPGTLGGAAVQNIGAYGAELSSVFSYADVIDAVTGAARRIGRDDASFAYRSSYFKQHPELIIVRVALRLAKQGTLQTTYADIARRASAGEILSAPSDVARVVRSIRAGKFPSGTEEGTAGSFFKNPIVTKEHAETLVAQFPGLPTFPQENGGVKIPLAWILDNVLSLKGYAKGPVRLYEKQPLVIVAQSGARATDVDALALEVSDRVYAATHISIEREVETIAAQ